MGDFTVTIQVWILCSVYFMAKNSSNLLVLTDIGPHKVENPLKWLFFVSPCVSDFVFLSCVFVYLSACLFTCLSVARQSGCLSQFFFCMKLEFYDSLE